MKKKNVLLLAALLFVATAFGCHHMSDVRGSGNRQKQTREVAAFTSIYAEGAFHIDVTAQKPASVEIEGDDNILPLVAMSVSNNKLTIKPSRSYSVNDPIVIRITVPNLESVSVNGAGKIDVAGLSNDKFEMNINGTSAVTVSGDTKLFNIDTNGAANIDANKLRATRAVVETKGVSRVELYASEQLDVSVYGPSNVVYSGHPTVNKTVNGPGTVQKRESTGS